MLLDTAAWAGPTSAAAVIGNAVERTTGLLRASGWSVLVARPDLRLDDLWLSLALPIRGTA